MKIVELTLPPAPPARYQGWMRYWRSVEAAMLENRALEHLASSESAPFLEGWVASFVSDVAVNAILQQADAAASAGEETVSPRVRGPRSLMIAGLAHMERRGAWLDRDQVHEALGIEAPAPEYVALRRSVIASTREQLGGRSGTEEEGQACPCCGSVLGPAPGWLRSATMYCAECLWVLPSGGWSDSLPPWCPVHHARAGRGPEAARAIDLVTFAVIPDSDPSSLQIRLPATPDAAEVARASLLALRPQLQSAERETVGLILTELVSSLLEPAANDAEVFEIAVGSTPSGVRVHVAYHDARRVSRIGPGSDAAGYSQQVLEQVSEARGIDVENGSAWALVKL